MPHSNSSSVSSRSLLPSEPGTGSSIDELDDLLARAARLAASHDLDPEVFMQRAWSACLVARPGLREQIEEKEWRAELKKLRKRGLVGSA